MPTPLTTGTLLFAGDWALADGDVETLAYVAHTLSDRLHGPLRKNLRELAKLCREDSDRAAHGWQELRGVISASLCATA